MRLHREDVAPFVFVVTYVVKNGEKKGGIDRNDLGRRYPGMLSTQMMARSCGGTASEAETNSGGEHGVATTLAQVLRTTPTPSRIVM